MRAAASRRDQVGTQIVLTLSGATGNLGMGLALMAIAPRIRHGAFSVGDLGLFTTYILVVANLPLMDRPAGRVAAPGRGVGGAARRPSAWTTSPWATSSRWRLRLR